MMSKLREIFFILIICLICISNANAVCKFDLNIGDNASKVEEKYGPPMPHFGTAGILPILANEVCPNEKLGEAEVEYFFIDNKLASITLRILNDEGNAESEKLLLFNYVKKNYGDFDAGQNPKAWTGFEVWEKNEKIIVYKKLMNAFNILEEELYISNEIYNEKLGEFFSKFETGNLTEPTD